MYYLIDFFLKHLIHCKERLENYCCTPLFLKMNLELFLKFKFGTNYMVLGVT